MTRLLGNAVLFSGVVLAAGCGGSVQQTGGSAFGLEAEEGWVVLFDGETLNGWEARPTFEPNNSGDWRVEDGALICGGTVPSWIHTNQEYEDFRFALEFQGADSVNSGIFLRSEKEGQPHQTGYELQIWDYQPAGYNTGSLVEYVVAPPAPPIVPSEWNSYEVTVQGDRFVAVLNGDTILDAHDDTHASGVIGLQCQENYPIQFRNIRILPLG